MNRFLTLTLLLALALPLSADDARERQDIARELHRIAVLSDTRPPTRAELVELRKFHGRELAAVRRSLEIIRRSIERQTLTHRQPSVANGGTSPRQKPRFKSKLHNPGKLGATKPFGK